MKNYILISDAQQLFKESISRIIHDEIDKKYIYEYYCSYKTLKQGLETIGGNIHLVVLSTNLIDIDSIDRAIPILKTLTKAPILVTTSVNSVFFFQDIIDAGAEYYLLKTSSHEKCKETVANILSGKKHLQPKALKYNKMENNQLSKRQYEVLSEIAQGLLNKQIAAKLNISEATVKIHISAILIKLSVNNRTEAAIKFFQER